MADNPQNPIAGASESPKAGVTLPFALDAGMTPELARAKLDELKTDADWQTRFFAGDKRTLSEFDQLTRRVTGAGADKPAEAPDLVRPPAPPSAGFYQFPARVLDTPEATAQAAEARSVAFEHGVTLSEFTGVAEQQRDDTSRFDGMTEDQKIDTVVNELGRIFGEHYDKMFANIERYFGEHPSLKQQFNQLGLGLNKRAVMVLADLATSRYGLR